MQPLWLTPDEIVNLCAGLVRPGAQVRELQRLGFTVAIRRDGTPLLSRAHFDRVMGGSANVPTIAEADMEAEARNYRVGHRQSNVVQLKR